MEEGRGGESFQALSWAALGVLLWHCWGWSKAWAGIFIHVTSYLSPSYVPTVGLHWALALFCSGL